MENEVRVSVAENGGFVAKYMEKRKGRDGEADSMCMSDEKVCIANDMDELMDIIGSKLVGKKTKKEEGEETGGWIKTRNETVENKRRKYLKLDKEKDDEAQKEDDGEKDED